MNTELTFLLNTFIAIFVIVDPFAVVPVYLSLTDRFGQSERRAICRKSSIIAMIVLTTFAVTGMAVFRFFGITLPAFQIAGGLLLMSFGLSQLNRTRERMTESEHEETLEREDISLFPLATPLLAGPGSISTVVLYSSEPQQGPLRVFLLVLAIGFVMLATYYMLRLAPMIYRVLGKTGLNLLTRIMGIIVTAIAIQFIINGVKEAFKW